MPDNSHFDPLIRKSKLLELIPIDENTLHQWIRKWIFPKPYVLNEGIGGTREIVAWRESDYLAWRESLPQRQAKRLNEKAYLKNGRKPKLKIVIGRPTE